ncbi:uncharacterized protein DS421_19g667300 [Arachis hypogaea]|uniref:Uncharacterized protein n=1 Tax=Arachis hypogaea TaxID=3818 RepID=A0A6B9VCK5_ARAHY|nr:uncharacterized protein DS421_19g667300 [Arachis hypogaea]
MNQRRATISLFNSFLRIRYPLRPSTTTLTSPLPFFVTNSTSKPQSIRTIAPMVWQNPRSYSSGSCNDLDHNKEVDAINLKFAEAREVAPHGWPNKWYQSRWFNRSGLRSIQGEASKVFPAKVVRAACPAVFCGGVMDEYSWWWRS